MLIFEADGQVLRRLDGTSVVADSRNYLYALFLFSDDWGDATKTAIFATEKDAYIVLIGSNGKCLVPYEVLRERYFYVSAFAGNRITANKVKILVIESGYQPGKTPEDPTPDVYAQIMERLDALTYPDLPPVDGKLYGMQDRQWVEIHPGGSETAEIEKHNVTPTAHKNLMVDGNASK